MTVECYRCGDVYSNARRMTYVSADDTNEVVSKEVMVALKHTPRTRGMRKKVVNQHEGVGDAEASIILSRNDKDYLHVTDDSGNVVLDIDCPSTEFDREVVRNPKGPEEDPEVVKTTTEVQEVEENRTGLVCGDCVKEGDTEIW